MPSLGHLPASVSDEVQQAYHMPAAHPGCEYITDSTLQLSQQIINFGHWTMLSLTAQISNRIGDTYREWAG